MIVRINVTQEDIDKGCKRQSDNCAVARAVQRATWARDVSVYEYIGWTDGEDWHWAKTPTNVLAWIDKWDAGKRVAPLSFDIDVPTWMPPQPADPIGPELARNQRLRKDLEESDTRLDSYLSNVIEPPVQRSKEEIPA